MMALLKWAVVISVVAVVGCAKPLPEAGTPAATLYAKRCGSCHIVYPPAMLTPKMWETMVGRMEGEMIRARFGPLSDADREMILAYLARNGAER